LATTLSLQNEINFLKEVYEDLVFAQGMKMNKYNQSAFTIFMLKIKKRLEEGITEVQKQMKECEY
jgi:hypothetical protein